MSNKEKINDNENEYVPLPIYHQCSLKQNSIIIDITSLDYYNVCDYCRDTVRKYTAPYKPIDLSKMFPKKNFNYNSKK